MDYYDYRSFIKSKIKSICPEFKEHKDGFNRENIDSVTAESGYHVLPVNITSEPSTHQNDDYEDTLNVNLQLIFCGGRYVAEKIDEAISKASCIRNELIKRDQFPLEDTLLRVLVTGITPVPATSNDNAVIISMDLTLILQYCTDSCA